MNQESTPENTGLTSEHRAVTGLAFMLAVILLAVIAAVTTAIVQEDKLAAVVAKDQGAVAAYCLYKAPNNSAVCSILASKGEVK